MAASTSAPRSASVWTSCALYAIGRLGWIKKQRAGIIAQPRETPRTFVDRESHYFRGQRYLLRVREEARARPRVQCKGKELWMTVPLNATTERKRKILDDFYRVHLKMEIPQIIAMYEPRMGVTVADFRIQRMKTKWGSCNIEARRIRLNLELARKPPECLEYLVVHEMVHLLERRHTARFRALMDRFMPGWADVRRLLNALPVAHVEWVY